LSEAIRAFDKALALDGNNSMALTGKVLALYMLIASGLSEDPAQGL